MKTFNENILALMVQELKVIESSMNEQEKQEQEELEKQLRYNELVEEIVIYLKETL